MILFYSIHVALKQDYLHSIHFYSFPFLYFKTSNQGYLIPFFSIPFLYLSTFHSFLFPYNHFIPFSYELRNRALVVKSTKESIKSYKVGGLPLSKDIQKKETKQTEISISLQTTLAPQKSSFSSSTKYATSSTMAPHCILDY